MLKKLSIFLFVILMYYFSLIPNISFTKPLRNFGTFFTTMVIFPLSFSYLQDNHMSPTATIVTPIANSQPDRGSNRTSRMPSPNPIKHTPIVFFNAHNMF